MAIEWDVVLAITVPIVTIVFGAWLNHLAERRPKLISYFGHLSAFNCTPANGQPFAVNTHSVVLHNAGRQSATNIRLHHLVLPEKVQQR